MGERRHPAADAVVAGPFGVATTTPVRLGAPLADMVELRVPPNGEAALRAALRNSLRLELPAVGHATRAGQLRLLATQPLGWVVVTPSGAEGALARMLRDVVGDNVAVVDQSHGRCLLTVEGAAAPELLARFIRIDLAPDRFGLDHVAATRIGHVSGLVWHHDPRPGFALQLFSSYAEAVWRDLVHVAAGFGGEVVEDATFE
jgi:sarcosine oxidase subunit gamma